MFEKAARQKLRFNTPLGTLTVEDLWDLPLTSKIGKVNLDDLAKDLNRQMKATEEESFVERSTTADPTITLRFELVKHIINVRVDENKAKNEAQARKEQKEKIRSLIAQKRDEEMTSKSIEELQAELAKLD